MISNIVDSDGLLVYTGNDVNPKFATVLARTGNQRVDGDVPDLEYPKWNGTDWIEGKTALQQWKEDMQATDRNLPRWMEDYITENVTLAPGRVKDNYDAKVALRATKPGA